MRKLIFILLFLNGITVVAQTNVSQLSYYSFVNPSATEMTPDLKSKLSSRLEMVVMQHALGATELTRFGVECSVNIVEHGPMTGFPVTHQVKGTFDFVIIDIEEKLKFGSASISFDGRGDSFSNALSKSIARIDLKDKAFKEMFASAEFEIRSYYNKNCRKQLDLAESKLGNYQFDEAIFILLSIPEFCGDCLQEAQTRATEIYKAKENYECTTSLNSAKAIWQTNQDLETARKIGESLASINPEASCVPDIDAFLSTVAKDVQRIHQQEWDFKYTREIVNEQQRIESARQVGIAYGKNQASAIYTK